MRAILNGVLAYGLMNVPVGVCAATQRKEHKFRTLHKACEQPISQVKQCSTCQADNLSSDELVQGFEFSKGHFVVLDPSVRPTAERSPVISVRKFVAWDDLDELQVDRNYYLQPNSVLMRPYQLLSTAMGAKEAVGLGSAALWGKEFPSMVWARESGALVLSLLFCHDEVVDDTPIVNSFGLVPQEEQELANQLVSMMMRDMVPGEDLISESRILTEQYISALIASEEFTVTITPEREPTVDVVEALKKSLDAARRAA